MSDSIAVTSGKGGVGKTTIAVNLSIALKKIASEIFLLDTDLGMANSHVLLGVNPGLSLSDVISGEKGISEVIIPCKSGVKLISGGTASSNLLNVENTKRYNILNGIDDHLRKINNVKLVVDIPAGAEDNALVFAMACDRIVIVIVGEPTSFVDSYALLKAINSKSSFKNFCIIVNQVENEKEGKNLFTKFQKITTNFLDVNLHYAGCIKNSAVIKKSIINRYPVVQENPKSEISQSFLKIAKKIYETPKNEWGGLTFLSKVKKRA
jgi:flagellar biosynthesis protein FlhG